MGSKFQEWLKGNGALKAPKEAPFVSAKAKGGDFGDTASQFGNDELDAAKFLLENAGDVASQSYIDDLPDWMKPYGRAVAYPADLANAALLGGLGALYKGTALGAEYVAGEMLGQSQNKEKQLARDLLGGLDIVGVGPEARMVSALSAPAKAAMAERAPYLLSDAKYALKSAKEGDLAGIWEALQSGGIPKSVGAEAVSEAERLYMDQRNLLIDRRNNINNVEMYSPSLRSAEGLTQEKGTYEQLRKMMLNSGAKADELEWSGADREFAGKKVTKQEIVDYLTENTKMREGVNLESSGKLGNALTFSEDQMVNDYVESVLDDEIQYYRDEIMPDLVDELETYVRVHDADMDVLEETARRKGISVDELIELHGDEYIDLENSLRLKSFDDVVDANFDVEDIVRENLYDSAKYEARTDPEKFWTDYLGRDIEDLYGFDEGDTQYSEYFTQGGENYQERLVKYKDPTGLVADSELPSARHFGGAGEETGLIGWARTADFPNSETGNVVRLIGELQSDVAKDVRVSNMKPKTFDEMVAGSEWQKGMDAASSKYNNTIQDLSVKLMELDEVERQKVNSELALLKFADDKKRHTGQEIGTNVKNWPQHLVDEFLQYQKGRHPLYTPPQGLPLISQGSGSGYIGFSAAKTFLDQAKKYNLNSSSTYETQKLFDEANQIWTQETSQLEELGNIARRNAEIGDPVPESSLPYVDATSKWVDMLLRKNIFDAIKEGQTQIATPNSQMVRDMTYGTPEGQGAFYDNIVPRRLQEVARKIDPEARVQPLSIETANGNQNVFGLNLDDRFISNAAKKGIPTWMLLGGLGLDSAVGYLNDRREKKYGPRRSLLEM